MCAIQQDDALRHQFKADVALYKKESIVFIDETGSNMRSTMRTHGYSIKRKPLEAQKLVVKGEHVSTIAAMSMQGIISLKIV